MTLTLCGLIIHGFGWDKAYFVTSGLMLLFYLLWVYLAYDTPDQHPTITENERNYIKEAIGKSVSKQKVSVLFIDFSNQLKLKKKKKNGYKRGDIITLAINLQKFDQMKRYLLKDYNHIQSIT